ncbi:DDB1- and CUL4-associated factor 8-like [Zingiber officinale]|uniref:DDB1- and CUL4-associated factor 8-like n=1 Tax=Zingiber officinale TaxID=94328 RepID=UPI001C4B9411|nr:DDB1- and CUL4-associated factor 8-like [Zingiber officinale]
MKKIPTRAADFSPGVLDLWHRELGGFTPQAFARRFGASEDLVMRFRIYRKLDNHRGCVNTVSFNADGDILISGSDDQKVILWDWDAGYIKLSFDSGHSNNVFHARFMPYTDDRTIVTCAADGQVRHAEILQGGKVATTLLTNHVGRAHKLGIEPGSPHTFYSCGEDGVVQHIDLRTKNATKLFTCTLDDGEVNHLNAIAINPSSPNLFAIAGTDVYARVYDIRKYKSDGSTDCGYPSNMFCPLHLIDGDHDTGITGVAFSDQGELLTSYSDEHIYLFTKDHGLGPRADRVFPESSLDVDTGVGPSLASPLSQSGNQIVPQIFKGHTNCETVKGVGFFGPNCEYVTSGSDCGRVFIWRKRDGKLLRAMKGDKYAVNCIEAHPCTPVIATSGIENDVKIWTPTALEQSSPVKLEELECKNQKTRFLRFALPEDMIAQIFALQRMQSRADDNHDPDLRDAIMHLRNRDHSDGDSEDGDTSANPGDCIVN